MPADGRVWARVVGASALGAVLFGEPEADEVVDRLEHVVLVAPSLRFELAKLCWKKVRRHPEKRDALVRPAVRGRRPATASASCRGTSSSP